MESLERSSKVKINKISYEYGNTSNTVEKIISVAETSNKVYEPKTYKKQSRTLYISGNRETLSKKKSEIWKITRYGNMINYAQIKRQLDQNGSL